MARSEFEKIAAAAGAAAERLKNEAVRATAPQQVPHLSVDREIAAPARAIFDVLATPARHTEIDGSGTLRGRPAGPARLYLGAKFSMGMEQQSLAYTSTSEVVEFVENERICWQTYGEVRGFRFVGGQKWRYELIPVEGDRSRTLVRGTYDWSKAYAGRLTVEMLGFPAKARDGLSATLRRLESVVTHPDAGGAA